MINDDVSLATSKITSTSDSLMSDDLCVHVCVQLSGTEKPPAGEPEISTLSSAAAGTEAPADGSSKVSARRPLQ